MTRKLSVLASLLCCLGWAQAAGSGEADGRYLGDAAAGIAALPPEAVTGQVEVQPVSPGATITVDPLQPTVALDLDSAAARDDLWARVRLGFGVADQDDEYVRKWEQWYASRPDYVRRMTERGGRYLFHVMEEVNKRGLPSELALLPFIESAFNPRAMSTAKASGMWQFIPTTGRDFDLRQNIFRDDRRDVLASTRAALDYLSGLHQMFGDWQLALAAYNWGQGNVARAIKRNQAAGLPTDYASLRMPDETRNYYPKLQAVKNIVSRPDAFALVLPELRNHPYFVSVGINRDIDIELAARLAQLPLDEFHQLNPQMNKPVILAAGTPQVLLPYDNANAFVKALAAHKGSLATWTAWVAQRTMKPADVAREVGMSEGRLREVNAIPGKMLVKAGSTLLVPRDPRRDTDVAEAVADNAALALAPDLPPLRRVALKAGRKGESVAAIAQRYKVSPGQVAQWNHTSATGRFAAGAPIVLMLPAKGRAAGHVDRPAPAADPAPATATARSVATSSPASRVKAASAPVPVAGKGVRAAGKAPVATARTTAAARPARAAAVAKAAPATTARVAASRNNGSGGKRAKPGPAARAHVAQN